MVLQLTVADVMTKPVLTVTPDTQLQQPVQIISDHHVSGLPVVDAEGRLIGELTEQAVHGYPRATARRERGCPPPNLR